MKFSFLQKRTSRREMLRGSATLASSALLTHLFPATLLRASAADFAQAPSPDDLLASMRAKFNAVPMKTQKLAYNVTMFGGPGGAVVVCYAKIPSDPYLIEMLSLISSVSLRMGTAKSSTKLAENFSQQTARCAILATHVTILY